MLKRCNNPASRGYEYYGGRGIQVCEEWRNSFKQFLEDMGKAPTKQHSIDRINSEGNYCKENCRWATPREQARNTRRNRKIPLPCGEMCIAAASEYFSLPYRVLRSRLSKKWPPLEAVLIPKGEHLRPLTTIEILSAYL
jgi:hypothetical protein